MFSSPRATLPSFKAFSLLELLVVISIITILMAIMVPAMFHFIQYVRHLGGN